MHRVIHIIHMLFHCSFHPPDCLLLRLFFCTDVINFVSLTKFFCLRIHVFLIINQKIVTTFHKIRLNNSYICGILESSQKKELIRMRYTITGRNIEVTPGLRDAVQEKLGKLECYFTPDTEICATLSVQKDVQKIEVTIPVKGSIIRAEESSNDMYVSIDLVEEIIERQLKKYKNKLADQKQAASVFKKEFIEKEFEDEEEIKIIRSKKFDIKPMYPEDACIQMELLGHSFFVFCNAETDQVNVVYKRKGNTYGLIEPEL